MERIKWAAVLAGVMAVVIGVVSGCFNPIIHMPAEDAPPADVPPADVPSADGNTGITWEEFTITLRVGEDSRAVVGPDTGDIQYGAIRNIAQIIVVDAETGAIADFKEAVRKNDNDPGMSFMVRNLWAGRRYHFLLLMGHRERDYVEEAKTIPWLPDSDYIWKRGGTGELLPPTLLAAGFLADQTIPAGGTIISITMKPLVVDTVFEYEGVTAQAALGGLELPSGVGARLVWTITGGALAMLVDAQNKGGPAGGVSNWGMLNLAGRETILSLDPVPDPPETPGSPVLGGADHNRIVLDLGARDSGTSGSANFNLKYVPFNLRETGTPNPWDGYNGNHEPAWIIRNGINDLAQDAGTSFPNPSASASSPWSAVKNGNGAVGFTAAQGSVDLTGFVPAPSVGGAPQTTFYTSRYIGKVKWIPNHSTFQAGVAYQATITLDPAAGHVFSSGLTASHGGAASVAVTHEYDLSAYIPVPIRNAVLQKQDGIAWVDYSTDKWTIHAYWRDRGDDGSPDDGWWSGKPGSFTAASYGALIILKADKGYPFDEGIDFKYPTYSPDNVSGPVRGYYVFDYYSGTSSYYSGFGKTSCYWLWQNAGNPTSPPPKYDTAPKELYYGTNPPIPDDRYPLSIKGTSKAEDYATTGKLDYKPRTEERFVMVGFNTQNTVPVPVSKPSDGPDGGVRLVTLGFNPLPIPSNVDSGGDTFAQAVAMIRAAQQAGAGYLSLTLDGLTKDGKGKDPPDTSVAAVSFSIADSPPSVVVDGGNRVVQGTDVNIPYITVGNGVTLTLRNITLKADTHSPVVRVESGGVLILEEGAVITGHTTTHSTGGGGVYVAGGGTLTMKGGEISGNTATGGNGGGVYVAGPGGGGGLGGSFTMQGGTIKNNNANSNGGAVYVDNGGTFFMQGGTVSGNTATGGNGGGAYVATGGTFVKATGAMIYGGGVANANTAAVSGHAVYVQGGRYRDDTVVDFLDSGRSITAGGWDYPVIPHTYYETDGTDGHLAAAGQVDWYVFTAPGGGAPLSVSVESGPVKASAYRAYGAYGAPISLNAAPPAFAAGETVYVKVEGNAPDVTGTYKIRQGPLLLISDSHPVGSDKANPGNITAAGQVDWYFFTAENDGTYSVMWEDSIEQAAPYYTGNVKVSAYKYDATPIPGLVGEDNGYNGAAGKSLGYLDAGDTIYVKAVAQSANGTYGIRYYAP